MSKLYDTLYARSNTGNTLLWRMERVGNKYRTISGIEDGKLVTSEWTVAEGKNLGKTNETSDSEQAEAEIQSRYDKQLKSGGYHKMREDIDFERFFSPMLAKSFSDYADKIDWKTGVGVQVKYNGGRIIAAKNGLYTRKGELYKNLEHIEKALVPFFKIFPKALLDGEGFNFHLRQNLKELMKLLRRTVHITDEHRKKSAEMVRFYIYDGVGVSGTTAEDGYEERKKAIDDYFRSDYVKGTAIHYVPTWTVKSKKELDELYEGFLKDEQEGAIIRIYGQPYENKRTKNLLKYKPVDDAEFKVIAVEEGTGNWSKVAKVFTCQRIDGKKFKDGEDTFKATFKGDYEEAAKCLAEKHKYIGKVFTIYYNGLTGYGKPNYARFDINNCEK